MRVNVLFGKQVDCTGVLLYLYYLIRLRKGSDTSKLIVSMAGSQFMRIGQTEPVDSVRIGGEMVFL